MGSVYLPTYTAKDGTKRQSRVFWIQYYVSGKPVRESSGTRSKAEARALLKEREGAVVKGMPVRAGMNKIRMDELFDDMLANYTVRQRRSVNEVRARIAKHLRPYFGHRKACEVTTADFERYQLNRLAAGASRATTNRELAAVRFAFNLARKRTPPKILVAPHIAMLAEHNVRTGFLTDDQFRTLLAHLPAYLKPVVEFAWLTGWRRREVLSLEWRSIDFAAGMVTLDTGSTKNGDGRTFPLISQLRHVLEAQFDRHRQLQQQGKIVPFVFTQDNGKQISDFRTSWRSACVAAGLPDALFHDLRRCAVRRFVRAGIPQAVAMKLSGHRTPATFARYNIVDSADMATAASMLDPQTKPPPKISRSEGDTEALGAGRLWVCE